MSTLHFDCMCFAMWKCWVNRFQVNVDSKALAARKKVNKAAWAWSESRASAASQHLLATLFALRAEGCWLMMAGWLCVISRHRNCQNRYWTTKGSGGGLRNEAVGPKNECFSFFPFSSFFSFAFAAAAFLYLALNSISLCARSRTLFLLCEGARRENKAPPPAPSLPPTS